MSDLWRAVELTPPGMQIIFTREALLEARDAVVGTVTRADMTVPEVAEHFGRSPSTIRSWIAAGHLRAYKMRGRQWRVTSAAVTEFEESERAGTRAAKASPRSKVTDLGAWKKVP